MPTRLNSEIKGAVAPLLLMALNNAQVGVAVKADDGTYLYASGLPDYFPDIQTPGAKDEDLFEGDWLEKMETAKRQVLENGDMAVLELARTSNSEFCICECTVQRYEIAGDVPALLITFMDLTPERKREETLRALLRELSHRTKNLLAIVQSIASQTARTSERLDVFVSKFRGRLAALSSSQDLVTESNWRGAHFQQLASRQFTRYVESHDPRVKISGENILLSPNGATHVGLALHELITNSVAFGALSSKQGRLILRCDHVDGPEGDGNCLIDWDETMQIDPADSSGESPNTNSQKKFGSTVLERVVPTALDGDAEYSVTPGHVSYRLRFNSS